MGLLWILVAASLLTGHGYLRWLRPTRVLRKLLDADQDNIVINTKNNITTSEKISEYVYYEFSDAEMKVINELALGEDHSISLGKKVRNAMEEEYDINSGVNPLRTKSLPLKINIDIISYHARQSFLKGNFSESLSLYQKCIDYNPVDGRPWLGMARIYWKKGNVDAAKKAYKDGLYYNNKNPFLLQSYAVMLEKLGSKKEAIVLLENSVKHNPTHAASWVALAKLRERFGDIDDARNCYSKAVDGDPRGYVALQAWGVLEAKCNNIDVARSLFQRAIDASKHKSSHSYQAYAKLEMNQGNLAKSEKLLNQALKVYPSSTRVRLNLAEISELRGDITGSRKYYQDGERYANNCGDAGFFQSYALFELRQSTTQNGLKDNNENIRRLFKKAIAVNKYHSASWIAWAKYEQKLGNIEESRKLLIAGISKFPNSKNVGWFHCALGNLAYHDGDYNTARSCYSRALSSTSPQSMLPVLLEYAKMEGKAGVITEARRLYELAAEKFASNERLWNEYIQYETSIANTNSNNLINKLNERKLKAVKVVRAEITSTDSYDDYLDDSVDKNTIDDAFNFLLDEIDKNM